jgi:hypothetical protein
VRVTRISPPALPISLLSSSNDRHAERVISSGFGLVEQEPDHECPLDDRDERRLRREERGLDHVALALVQREWRYLDGTVSSLVSGRLDRERGELEVEILRRARQLRASCASPWAVFQRS